MPYLYIMSDMHGEIDAFETALDAIDLDSDGNRFIMLGDYIPRQGPDEDVSEWTVRCGESLGYVRWLQDEYPGKVDALAGNWERWFIERIDYGYIAVSDALEQWLRELPYVLETEEQVLVHAGIDERAGRRWRDSLDDAHPCLKYPPTFGRFEKDVVAGHVGTCEISGDADFHGVFWDGESHYYIDGTTEESGVLPLLRYDTEVREYSYATATRDGVLSPWLPVEPMVPKGF